MSASSMKNGQEWCAGRRYRGEVQDTRLRARYTSRSVSPVEPPSEPDASLRRYSG
jgi:hypothetical protein